MKPAELTKTLRELETIHPECELEKNTVGNLVIIDESGEFLGYIDLRFNELCLDLFEDEEVEA